MESKSFTCVTCKLSLSRTKESKFKMKLRLYLCENQWKFVDFSYEYKYLYSLSSRNGWGYRFKKTWTLTLYSLESFKYTKIHFYCWFQYGMILMMILLHLLKKRRVNFGTLNLLWCKIDTACPFRYYSRHLTKPRL